MIALRWNYAIIDWNECFNHKSCLKKFHYDDVIMGAIASLITSLTIVYSTGYSDADQRKHQSSASLAFVWGIHRGFPAQMASNAENVSIWWRHHAMRIVRVIIARYGEDSARSERRVISSGRSGRAWAPCGPKSVRLSVDEMLKCIPFNGSAAFWQSLCL